MTITIHQVLAGAYRGKDLADRPMLTHASSDGGDTALCGRVAHLCDLEVVGPPTCRRCATIVTRLKLRRYVVEISSPGITDPGQVSNAAASETCHVIASSERDAMEQQDLWMREQHGPRWRGARSLRAWVDVDQPGGDP